MVGRWSHSWGIAAHAHCASSQVPAAHAHMCPSHLWAAASLPYPDAPIDFGLEIMREIWKRKIPPYGLVSPHIAGCCSDSNHVSIEQLDIVPFLIYLKPRGRLVFSPILNNDMNSVYWTADRTMHIL